MSQHTIKKVTQVTDILPEEVENFPTDKKGAMIVRYRGKIMVIHRKTIRRNGVTLESDRYLGYVIDNRFYSLTEYREKFRPVLPEKKTRRSPDEPKRSYRKKEGMNSSIGPAARSRNISESMAGRVPGTVRPIAIFDIVKD